MAVCASRDGQSIDYSTALCLAQGEIHLPLLISRRSVFDWARPVPYTSQIHEPMQMRWLTIRWTAIAPVRPAKRERRPCELFSSAFLS